MNMSEEFSKSIQGIRTARKALVKIDRRTAELEAENTKLKTAVALFMEAMNSFGEWDDGHFYYNSRSAPELQAPIDYALKIYKRENCQ